MAEPKGRLTWEEEAILRYQQNRCNLPNPGFLALPFLLVGSAYFAKAFYLKRFSPTGYFPAEVEALKAKGVGWFVLSAPGTLLYFDSKC